MVQKKLAVFADGKAKEDELFVHLTIYDVPASLLRKFGEKVVKPFYPDGVSTAIKDLMRKAIIEREPIATHFKQNESEANG